MYLALTFRPARLGTLPVASYPSIALQVNSARKPHHPVKAGHQRQEILCTTKEIRWRELCKNLDSRTTNSKLWRIVKKINREQEQCDESNSVIDTNGQVFPDDKAAANGLAVYYHESSKLVFTSEDKSVMKRAKNISSMAVAPLMWVIRACPGTSHKRTSASNGLFGYD
ncbi:uncharacterized protein TNCV_4568681 [Trichonephila clavipes]|nr:uncharacterized protein TNCV_4568681 [Trichonephila clavipes]